MTDGKLFNCDGCGAGTNDAGSLYPLTVSLPGARDAFLGEYCESCAEEIAEEGTNWFEGKEDA